MKRFSWIPIAIFAAFGLVQAADQYRPNPYTGKLDNIGTYVNVSAQYRSKFTHISSQAAAGGINFTSLSSYYKKAAHSQYSAHTQNQLNNKVGLAKFTNNSTYTVAHIRSVSPYGNHPAAGSNRQVQYNNAGTPAGAVQLNYTSGYTKIGNGNYISEQTGTLTFTNKTTATLKTALALDAYGRVLSNAKFTTSASLSDGRGYQLTHTAVSGSTSINSYPRAMFAQLATFNNFTAGGSTTTVPTDVVGLQGQTSVGHRIPYSIGLFGRTVLASGASVYHKAMGLRGAVQASSIVSSDEAIGVESALQLANTSSLTATRFIYFNASEDIFGTGSTTFSEYYGIKLPSLTRGSSTNYSLYAPSGTLYNGGKIGVGVTVPDAKLTVKGDGTTTGLNITVKDSTDSIKITVLDSGLTKFSNGGGLPYGQMYSNTSTTITVGASGTWYEVDTGATDFTAGRLKNVTFTDHYLTAPTAGDYLINAAVSFGTATAGDEIALSVMVNGTASATCHGHATVVTATTTVPSSCVTILTLAANDQVSLAVQNHSAARNITLSHSQLSILHVGSP